MKAAWKSVAAGKKGGPSGSVGPSEQTLQQSSTTASVHSTQFGGSPPSRNDDLLSRGQGPVVPKPPADPQALAAAGEVVPTKVPTPNMAAGVEKSSPTNAPPLGNFRNHDDSHDLSVRSFRSMLSELDSGSESEPLDRKDWLLGFSRICSVPLPVVQAFSLLVFGVPLIVLIGMAFKNGVYFFEARSDLRAQEIGWAMRVLELVFNGQTGLHLLAIGYIVVQTGGVFHLIQRYCPCGRRPSKPEKLFSRTHSISTADGLLLEAEQQESLLPVLEERRLVPVRPIQKVVQEVKGEVEEVKREAAKKTEIVERGTAKYIKNYGDEESITTSTTLSSSVPTDEDRHGHPSSSSASSSASGANNGANQDERENTKEKSETVGGENTTVGGAFGQGGAPAVGANKGDVPVPTANPLPAGAAPPPQEETSLLLPGHSAQQQLSRRRPNVPILALPLRNEPISERSWDLFVPEIHESPSRSLLYGRFEEAILEKALQGATAQSTVRSEEDHGADGHAATGLSRHHQNPQDALTNQVRDPVLMAHRRSTITPSREEDIIFRA